MKSILKAASNAVHGPSELLASAEQMAAAVESMAASLRELAGGQRGGMLALVALLAAKMGCRLRAGPGFAKVTVIRREGGGGGTKMVMKVALQRVAILEAWEKCVAEARRAGKTEGEGTGEYLKEKPGLSRSTLFNWRRHFKAGGVAALIDGRSLSHAAEKTVLVQRSKPAARASHTQVSRGRA